MENIEEIKKNAYELARRYEMEYGCCSQYVLAAGGHSTACPVVCGKAAVWVIEILDEEGLL